MQQKNGEPPRLLGRAADGALWYNLRMEMMKLLVAGASSGIGRAVAVAAAERGARCVLTARREDELERTRAMMANPERHVVVPIDFADADGRDIAFTSAVANGPSRVTEALNGMDALYFNGESGRRLVANAATPEFRTVFFVNCVTNLTHPTGWSNMGVIGEVGKDNGLRFKDQTTIKADSMFFDGVLHIDGVSSMSVATQYDYMSVPKNKFIVTEAEVAIPVQNVTFAIGDYTNGKSYFGDIAEVIAYDRWLTDEERIATERYLQNKWGLKEVAANDVFTNVLPVATALTVAEGATLDLAGGYQEVASLSGAGTIANSFESQATLVLSSGTSEFSGTFSGDIYLEVAAGATLDLCGGTLTVGGGYTTFDVQVTLEEKE